jgi:polysaccharide pyruvyl transferase WcaK-like protein
MRILLTHMSSDRNKGDHAILSATVGALHELLPSSVITVVSAELPQTAVRDPADTRLTRALRCEVLGTPVPSRRRYMGTTLRWVISLVRAEIFLWAKRAVGDRALALIAPGDRGFFAAFAEADVVVAKGGSYLHALGGLGELIYLWRMLYPLRVAHSYGHKAVLLGVSFDTHSSILTKALIGRALRHRAVVCARERPSFRFARSELGISAEDLHLIPDVAFLIRNEACRRRDGELLSVGVTVRYNRFPAAARNPALDRYNYALQGALRSILERHPRSRIVFVPQVLEDVPLAYQIAGGLGEPHRVEVIDADLSLHALLALYAQLDLVIGTRLHSVILAAVSGVPFVHIIVEQSKSGGTLELLDMEALGVPYDQIARERLTQAVEHAIVNRDQLESHVLARVSEQRRTLDRSLRLLAREVV